MITLSVDEGGPYTGRYLSGRASWSFPSARERSLQITTTWEAKGRTEHVLTTVNHFSHAIHDMTGDVPFHLKLPAEGPLTFDGKLFTIAWLLKADMRGGDEIETVEMPFRVLPARSEVPCTPPEAAPVSRRNFYWSLIAALAAVIGFLLAARDLMTPVRPSAPELSGWSHDFELAQRQQRDSHQRILLYFRTKRCKPCDTIDRHLQSDQGIRRLSAFIRVQVDPKQERALADRFGFSTRGNGLVVLKEDEDPVYVDFLMDETTLLNAIDPPNHG